METTSSKEGNKSKTYLAFFDLDHTLTGSVSGRELAVGAYKRGLMKRSDLLNAIFLSMSYKMGLADPAKAINKMGGWVEGIRIEALINLSTEVSVEILIPSVYKQAVEEIQFHRNNNAGLVILSSTLAPVCSRISEHLGMDDILCSELETINGILTGRPEGTFCFGGEKAVRLKRYCEINSCKLQDAWYYGDSLSDLPALSIVGHPVCINPERKLERIARENGWKIFNWK